ncbi:phage protein NinX family protein [Pseudomonas migulae]|uniref:phage protein NinX family protein n=1 Tax=Pseudomonas migulae TaxID=78543 RepID=UPI003713EFB8
MGYKAVEIDELKGWWIDYVVGTQVCNRRAHILWAAGGYGADLTFEDGNGKRLKFSPSTSWGDAGPLLEEFKVSMKYEGNKGWTASVEGGDSHTHLFPLHAAMFALITSKVKDGYRVPTY